MVAKRRSAAYEIANFYFATAVVPVNLFSITTFVSINNNKQIDRSYLNNIKSKIGAEVT